MAELVESNGVITLRDTNDRPRLIIDSAGGLRTRDSINETDGSAAKSDSAVVATTVPAVFSLSGAATTGTGTLRYPISFPATIHNVLVSAGTAPTGADLIIDVNKNGTTIFTTQTNRPTIAAGVNASSFAIPDVTSLATNDYITVDIDQIGSTIAGSDLVVVVTFA